MPLPNEHSCRINSPSKYSEFRRVNKSINIGSKKADAIFGILKEKGVRKSELQSVRFPVAKFEEGEAKKWCKEHGGNFEKAS